MLLAITGIRLGEASLEGISIESNIVKEGSIGSLLIGKHCNGGVRFHKLFYEDCMRLVWEGFIT